MGDYLDGRISNVLLQKVWYILWAVLRSSYYVVDIGILWNHLHNCLGLHFCLYTLYMRSSSLNLGELLDEMLATCACVPRLR